MDGKEARSSAHSVFKASTEQLVFPEAWGLSWHQTDGPGRIIARLVSSMLLACPTACLPAAYKKKAASAWIMGTTSQLWTKATQSHGSQGS